MPEYADVPHEVVARLRSVCLAQLDALVRAGHPFFRAGWGSDVVGIVLDGATGSRLRTGQTGGVDGLAG
ncbi:MAG: hypothetical protein H0U26_08485 [Acidimicrobiia bacterium]|nr:hypothetical protein [Acidimicrobiia bacterium]